MNNHMFRTLFFVLFTLSFSKSISLTNENTDRLLDYDRYSNASTRLALRTASDPMQVTPRADNGFSSNKAYNFPDLSLVMEELETVTPEILIEIPEAITTHFFFPPLCESYESQPDLETALKLKYSNPQTARIGAAIVVGSLSQEKKSELETYFKKELHYFLNDPADSLKIRFPGFKKFLNDLTTGLVKRIDDHSFVPNISPAFEMTLKAYYLELLDHTSEFLCIKIVEGILEDFSKGKVVLKLGNERALLN